MNRRTRRGFTLVELLVVITIIGMLVALLMPAVQAAREIARETTCKNSQRQVALAAMEYETTNGKLPRRDERVLGYPATWLVHLLPYLEAKSIYDKWDTLPSRSRPYFELLICPSNPPEATDGPLSSYKGNGQVFRHGRGQTITYINQRDGTSNTMMISEYPGHPRWDGVDGQLTFDVLIKERNKWVPDRLARLTDTDPVRLGSNHSGGVVATFCDGHVQFLSDSIDIVNTSLNPRREATYTVFYALVCPDDGEILDDTWWK